MNNKKIILIFLALAIAGALIFFFIFYGLQGKKTEDNKEIVTTEQKTVGLDLCAGEIIEIQGQSFKIRAIKERNPLAEDRYFTVSVNSQTEILSYAGFDFMVNKEGKILLFPQSDKRFSSEEIKNENGEMVIRDDSVSTSPNKDIGNPEGPKKVEFDVLKVGDSVIAVSAEGNILEKDSFLAKQVYYQPK